MAAISARSVQPTQDVPHSSPTATSRPANGSTTPVRLSMRCSLDKACSLVRMRPSVLWEPCCQPSVSCSLVTMGSPADVLRPVLPGLADEIIQTIAGEVPDYERPMDGGFGQVVRLGVEVALGRFVEALDDPP